MTARKQGSIAGRLSIWFLVLAGVSALGVGIVMFSSFERVHQETVFKSLNGVADKKVDQISTYFAERIQDVELYGQSSLIKEALAAYVPAFANEGPTGKAYKHAERQYHAELSRYLQRTGYYDLFLINLKGDVVYSVVREADYATNLKMGKYSGSGLAQVARQAVEQLSTSLSFFEYYEPSQEHAAFLATPVMADGNLVGILAVQLDTAAVTGVVTDLAGLGQTGETIAVMKQDGQMLVTVPMKHSSAAPFSFAMERTSEEGQRLWQALDGDRGYGLIAEHQGQKVFAAWRYLPHLNWGMLTKIHVNEGMQEVVSARRNLLMYGVLGAVLIVLAALMVARSITRPLDELTEIAGKIAGGDFTHQAHVTRNDEIGLLARAFNTMSAQVRDSRDDLELRVIERTGELERANADLKLTASVVEHTSEGVVVTDTKGLIVEVNPAYCTITGYARDELIGQNPNINQSGHHDADFFKEMWANLHADGHWSGEIWDRRKDGSVYPKLLTINPIIDDRGQATHYIGVFKDITDIKAVENQLQELAYFDPLTALPNRSLFRDRLQQEVAGAERAGKQTALMLIDLDRFKYVNDTLGHMAGDDLLKLVAKRMTDRVREMDTVARLGGDEFTIVLADLDNLKSVGPVAQDIIDILKKPFFLEGQDVYIGASVGISVYPDDAGDVETLIKNADMAMYRSKEAGRGCYHFFHQDMDAAANLRLKMEGNLRRALIHNEFVVYYQPKVDIRTKTIVGMEALVRWIDPHEGIISPADFIPVAEENGMVVLIDQFVLREACQQIKTWRAQGQNLRVAVNLSALQFKQSDLVEIIDGVLKTLEVPPEALELEITESAIMDDPEGAIALIQGLRDLGVYLSVDDFGTGYSSLAYLKKFPINALKIDQAFVRDLTEDSDDAAIVRAIISLSQSLGLGVVAEGIETKEQHAFLLEYGCTTGQGYLFSRPVPAEDFTALLAKGLD